jgi:hypothetical protein
MQRQHEQRPLVIGAVELLFVELIEQRPVKIGEAATGLGNAQVGRRKADFRMHRVNLPGSGQGGGRDVQRPGAVAERMRKVAGAAKRPYHSQRGTLLTVAYEDATH